MAEQARRESAETRLRLVQWRGRRQRTSRRPWCGIRQGRCISSQSSPLLLLWREKEEEEE